MTDPRFHWDDNLIQAVGELVIPRFRSVGYATQAQRDLIFDVIIAVEDWDSSQFTLLDLVLAKQSIQRVRDAKWQHPYPGLNTAWEGWNAAWDVVDSALAGIEHETIETVVRKVQDESELALRDELLYDAWCVIANAGFAPLNWRIDGKMDHLARQEREWVEAAERWRDSWHDNVVRAARPQKEWLKGIETLEEAVGVAIGAGSMCWETPEGAGVFDSTTAGEIVEQLIAWIGEHQ